MQIRSVAVNNRKRAFDVRLGRRTRSYPFAKARPAPGPDRPVTRVRVDPELGREAFTDEIASGEEGDVHVEEILEYNRDPAFERERLLYQLTAEAQERVAASPLSKREIVRRLGTSASQLYRVLDQTNDRKSIDQVVALLNVLECAVEVVVRRRKTA